MPGQPLGLRVADGRRYLGGRARPAGRALAVARCCTAPPTPTLGLDWSYNAIDCGVDELPGVLAARADWAGFSCTMPLKHALLDVAAEVAPLARAVGAANTLLPGPRRLDRRQHRRRRHRRRTGRARGRPVVGDAARAPAARRRPRSRRCSRSASTRAPRWCVTRPARPRAAGHRAAARRRGDGGELDAGTAALGADLVVSTCPPARPTALAGHAVAARQAVLDVVYAGWPTPLAAAAAGGGATVVSGALMLLHQAAAQVSLMTGQRRAGRRDAAALRRRRAGLRRSDRRGRAAERVSGPRARPCRPRGARPSAPAPGRPRPAAAGARSAGRARPTRAAARARPTARWM